MKIDYLMLAKYAEQNEDQTLNIIGGGISAIAADAVPVKVPIFFVVARVEIDGDDFGKPYTMVININDPEGMLLLEEVVLKDFVAPPPAEGMKGKFVFIVQILNACFSNFGRHELTLGIDGDVLKRTMFYIGNLSQDPKRVGMNNIVPVVDASPVKNA